LTLDRLASNSLALLALLVMSATANAALGEPDGSVMRDRDALRAGDLTVTRMPAYERHEMTTADGVRIREYAAPGGAVFAVTWSGRIQPDLKTMLGPYYADYQAATTRHRGGHHVLVVSTPGLRMRIVKLQRGFVGSARVPALTPAGVDPHELR